MQGEIYLDGEPVSFDGPPPATPAELANLLESHLNTQGLGLVSFQVDGQECIHQLEAAPLPSAGIQARSGNPWLERTEPLPALLEQLATTALTEPWPNVQARLGELDEAMQPLATLASKQPENNLLLAESWQALVQAAADAQPARLSELLAENLAPLCAQIREAAK